MARTARCDVTRSARQIYDDYSLRGSLETNRAGSPPQWVRVVDVACTPGRSINYEITLSGRNFAGWSLDALVESLGFDEDLTRPEILRNHVQSWQLSEDRAALALAWDAPLDSAGADTAYYNVYRDQGLRQALFQLIGTTQTPFFNDTGLDAGRAYGYQVTAVNAFGEGAVSDVLFVQAADTPVDDLSGLLSQANVQLTPAATFGVLDEVGGVVQIYSDDMARELRVEGYTGQRQAHVAAFGPVRLALEALDLAGNTGEEDPCEESKLAIAVGVPGTSITSFALATSLKRTPSSMRFRRWELVGESGHGDFALISWQTGWISSSSDTSSSGWRISLTPWR
ncbi:Uncharacterized protein SCF082_LOCUS15627 [Durusdinium trenchii]|uniref:Fibronectin type-III domain-containing protein n=1 Tax=Durusdinium trenchii TaxID=1381693 RepID=A0ABP0K7G3_9DINO